MMGAMKRWLLALASLLAVQGCDGSNAIELVVELKTDLTPGTEFASAQALLDGEAAAIQPAFAGDDFVSGRRIAELPDVNAGDHALVVQLRDDVGAVVVERHTSLHVEEDLGITVVITRDCVGVSCPDDAGGVALTCHGGRCVPPECSPALPTSCGTPECGGDADCGSCGVCADGVCLSPATSGCVVDAGPGDGAVDAPMSDAATDGGSDAAPDAGTDGGSPSVCDTTDTGLVACWLFEGNLDDETGRRDLTAAAPSFTDSGTARGQAVEMSMGHQLQLADGVTPPSFTSGTWQMWIRPDSVPSLGRRGLLELDGSYGIFLYADGTLSCRMATSGGGDATLRSATSVAPGDWHHIACTATMDSSQLYLDGMAEDGDVTNALALSSGTFMIGADAPSGSDAFEGAIDSVMLFDYVRTPMQIAADATP